MSPIAMVWYEMGFPRRPLLLSLLVVVSLGLWSASKLLRPSASPDLRTKAWLDAVLLWGGFATICGVLGTFVGITIAAQAIEAAGEIATTIIWGGIKVSMLSSLFGLLILAFSFLVWFPLQLRWRFLLADRRVG